MRLKKRSEKVQRQSVFGPFLLCKTKDNAGKIPYNISLWLPTPARTAERTGIAFRGKSDTWHQRKLPQRTYSGRNSAIHCPRKSQGLPDIYATQRPDNNG